MKLFLATRQEFFFPKVKVAPVLSRADILLDAALLNVYFILHYHLFFSQKKKIFRLFMFQ